MPLPTPSYCHQPVFLSFILKNLLPSAKKSLILDATLGEGGHSEAFLKHGHPVIALDRDLTLLSIAQERLKAFQDQFKCAQGNFKDAQSIFSAYRGQVSLILLDLGISQFHYFKSGRGFSFQNHEPLDMRLDPPSPEAPSSLSAQEIIASFNEQELTTLFRRYGEETHAARYAQAIITQRLHAPIIHSDTLADCITACAPAYLKKRRIHPATKIFQALRIFINQEISSLRLAIISILPLLSEQGRLAIISYHSLEDREIKNSFKKLSQINDNVLRTRTKSKRGIYSNGSIPSSFEHPDPQNQPDPSYDNNSLRPHFHLFKKKVIKPSQEEILLNRSARSAKLRVLVKGVPPLTK